MALIDKIGLGLNMVIAVNLIPKHALEVLYSKGGRLSEDLLLVFFIGHDRLSDFLAISENLKLHFTGVDSQALFKFLDSGLIRDDSFCKF